MGTGFCLLCGLSGQSCGEAVPEVNADRGGQPIELKLLPTRGKITVVDFFSPIARLACAWNRYWSNWPKGVRI